MNDIQKARDVLAKWRKAQTATPWQTTPDWTGDAAELSAADENPLGWMNHPTDARLIVGTAGNPDLLDAIDGLLSYMLQLDSAGLSRLNVDQDATRIAAAIIAADNRMQQ